MRAVKERTEFITNEMLEYLDNLRDSGVTNMYAGGIYLEEEFGLPHDDAQTVLVYWMETFIQRHA